ncbi:uncharacterized protein A1O9_12718 [Exophiala aquamarina CBS 119918]|uniref:AMP-dependent synthetase/ligase domain-containing protein n=1 Tax=Exophiala aquamarina CBS 119918 TaxID=1182545 RepID=A0A072P6H9_9EURO|nr:uncharacterized protein A1O9_12718 [Exophiala aquamarina CBS 119918]KEF51215.1 hypothetical protein A1O9_12718 [Exophiala aquamarina CBS 119918]
MAMLATSGVAAASLYYLDHKLGVSRDIASYRKAQEFGRRYAKYLAKLGSNSANLYRVLELANPVNDALWFEGRTWTYSSLKRTVDELAVGLYYGLGISGGDIVTVFMTNCPEMIFIIYAITKLGAAPALVNNSLRDETLLHCIRRPGSKVVITSPNIAPHVAAALKCLETPVTVACLNLGTFRPYETPACDVMDFPHQDPSSQPPLPTPPPATLASPGVLVFTSGTTGYPKACNIKNALATVVACTNSKDASNPKKYLSPLRVYSCMPLFHGTTVFGGIIASVGNSGCFCLGRKFSARGFFKEVHQARATRILYVGELLRFLLATPPGEYDRNHNVTVALGNGLQKDVWIAFQHRFNIPEVREVYRSSEGLVSYENIHRRSTPGAGKVGYAGLIRRKFLSSDQRIVKFDYDTEMPYRDPKTGFCIIAQKGEPGEAIGRVKSLDTYTNYYGDEEATEKKMLRDVFEKGDLWQRSGDLLVEETTNWVRFVDRIGDTYRWMGENVSANEIANHIGELPDVADVVVVGKRLEKYDGQTGAALIILKLVGEQQAAARESTFMKNLYQNIKKKGVPRYAAPRLINVGYQLPDVGATFKHSKASIKDIDWGNIEPNKTVGLKYWLDLESGTYKVLDREAWLNVEGGKARL